MNTTITIIILVSIAIIGFISNIISILNLKAKEQFSCDFDYTLSSFYQSRGKDNESYDSLIRQSNKMQNLLGKQGLVQLKPPYESYIVNNYAIVINGIPSIMQYFSMGLFNEQAQQMARLVHEAIIRNQGNIEQEKEKTIKSLKNPINWFTSGVQQILAIPVYLLLSFNIINASTSKNIVKGLVYRVISGIVSLLGFISSLLSIIFGWNQITQFLNTLIK